MTSTRVYDATALALFRECPEKYRQRILLGLVPDYEEEAPASGQAWHAAMRTWFSGSSGQLASTHTALREAWGDDTHSAVELKRPLRLFESLLDLYAEKYPRERDPFEVVRNEEWIEGPLPVTGSLGRGVASGKRFVYGGIVDRLVQMGGCTYVMDTKTTSSYLTDAYFATYQLSWQLRGYVALELVQGRGCEGAYIDAVHVDTRYQKAKPEHCVRYGPIRYDQRRLSEWARDAERVIREIEYLVEERGVDSRWPQHDNSCRNWGKLCVYHARCCLPLELVDALPGYRVEWWEPNKRDGGKRVT